MTSSLFLRQCVASVLVSALALAPSARAAESRGELLYSTHCIACHTSQGHWRDGKLATNWSSLRAEVRRWQAAAMLQWSEEDVLDVTRYLNDAFYRFPQKSDSLSFDLRR
jgi:mono/diheme cytochrome c family protein